MVPILVALLVAGVVVGVVLARRGAARVQERVEATLAGLDVRRQQKARLTRLASGGVRSSGAGMLALTPEELVFVQFVPDRVIRVPRPAITSAAAADGALVVAWGGEEAAWAVPDIDAWRAELGH